MTVKTTLVAGAPWPAKDAGTKPRAQRDETDANFEKWAKKNKDALVTGASLGMSIKEEIKCRTKKSLTRSTKTT